MLVTALTLVIGFPVAYYIAKIAPAGGRGRRCSCSASIPLWVSDLVRAFGWIVLLRETGLVSGVPAVGGAGQRAGRVPLQRRRRW